MNNIFAKIAVLFFLESISVYLEKIQVNDYFSCYVDPISSLLRVTHGHLFFFLLIFFF